jgi:hypothetical protein
VKAIYLAIGMVFTGLHLNSHAEKVQLELQCGKTEAIITELTKDFKETPIIMGKAIDNVNSVMSLWVNTSTGAWTLLSTKKDTTCVLGVGTDLELRIPPSGTKT